jgi:hypothetical protein
MSKIAGGVFLGAILILSANAAPMRTEQGPPTPQQLADGQALAERIRSAVPEENSEISGHLIIKWKDTVRDVPFVCQVLLTGTNWKTEYSTSATATDGAEKLIVVHSTNGPNQYLYAKAAAPSGSLPQLALIPPSQADIPLAGSDFSLTDLGLEYLHWPVQRQLKGEMRLGEPCYVLESSNTAPGGIVRIKSDIDKEYNAPLVVEAYDSDGRVIKEFSLHGSSFKKINGRWQMEKMDISNKKTGSHTELKFDLKEQ